MNAEFQRIARRDKKAFFSDQCKEIEENSRRKRLEISSKKLEIPREMFHAKMGTIKEAEDIKMQKILRRGGKNTQKNYTKKIFMTQITMMV